jgi:hypothetical protein
MSTAVEPQDQTKQELIDSYISEATEARKEYERAGGLYAGLVFVEAKLNTDKTDKWLEAIQRIMQTENPLTGKQHSGSSAKDVIETDQAYREHLELLRVTVRDKDHCHVRMESARMRAYTALAAVKALAGFLS